MPSLTFLFTDIEGSTPLWELFTERARQAQPEFPQEGDTLALLEGLCQQLEGTPLAIELAAAQTRTLTLRQIQEALQHRFTVLSSRMRDLHPRHRSLRATIDWSYQTLTEEEQRLFRGISCFVGSFTTAAAKQVCEVLCPPSGIPELLSALRDKSLLRLEHGQERYALPESGRYLLQDSLREYGAEALGQEQEAPWTELQRRHGSYFQQLVQREAAALRGPGQRAALTALELDAPNIRVAQEYLLSREALSEAARLAVSLGRFWEIRGWLREGRERLLRLLRQEHQLSDPVLLTELLLCAGRLEWNGANPALAVRYLERALTLQPLPPVERGAHTVLGMIAFSQGELLRSDQHYEAALATPVAEDRAGEATLRINLGINALTRGEFARALPLFEEALAFREAIGDTVRQAHAWNCIGAAAAGLEERERAHHAFTRSLELYQALGDVIHAAHVRINLGDLAVRAGRAQEALLLYEAAFPSLHERDDSRGIVVCYLGQARAQLALANLPLARACLRSALALSQQRHYRENQASALELVGELAEQEGDPVRAAQAREGGQQLRESLRDAPVEQEALVRELLLWLTPPAPPPSPPPP